MGSGLPWNIASFNKGQPRSAFDKISKSAKALCARFSTSTAGQHRRAAPRFVIAPSAASRRCRRGSQA